MARVCSVEGREGCFKLLRMGPVNSRVQLIQEGGELRPSELVATDSLRNTRFVDKVLQIDQDTVFRTWFEEMLSGWGARPEWPQLLVSLMHRLYLEERKIDRTYQGERLGIDRDRTPVDPTGIWDEKTSVRNLFNRCSEISDGCLKIGDEDFWLLGFEVTNQLRHQGRRADLVALSGDGGIVVFEAKLAKNGYAPVCALLEGLDYLTALTCDGNFTRLCQEVEQMQRPREFRDVALSKTSRHEVIVLAPPDYFYGTFDRSPRGKGWKELARLRDDESDQIRFRFAATDFTSTTAEWEYGE